MALALMPPEMPPESRGARPKRTAWKTLLAPHAGADQSSNIFVGRFLLLGVVTLPDAGLANPCPGRYA